MTEQMLANLPDLENSPDGLCISLAEIYSNPRRRGLLPITAETLRRWVADGKFPKPDISTGHCRFYKVATLKKALEDLNEGAAA